MSTFSILDQRVAIPGSTIDAVMRRRHFQALLLARACMALRPYRSCRVQRQTNAVVDHQVAFLSWRLSQGWYGEARSGQAARPAVATARVVAGHLLLWMQYGWGPRHKGKTKGNWWVRETKQAACSFASIGKPCGIQVTWSLVYRIVGQHDGTDTGLGSLNPNEDFHSVTSVTRLARTDNRAR